MKILLLGKNGQVGWELQRALAPLGEVIALDRHSTELCGNLTNLDGLRSTLRAVAPDIIVNAAAYTAVDKAESDRADVQMINVDATRVMAEESAASGAWLVHYSTDYVFDGSGETPWTEGSNTSPVNFYGETKLAAEHVILSSGCKHLVFRTSWVYSAHGNNFAKTMLRLAKDREHLSVIVDQVGAPTGAELLADVAAHAIRMAQLDPSLSGIYHLAAAGEISWYGYAQFVIDFANKHGEKLTVKTLAPIPTSSYPTPATRPLNSRMDTRKLRETFKLHLPGWQQGVARMLMEILRK